ncbi:hypothetical protein NEMIN01_0785 [Nematocida minor]|uniref:uncharacterized protein n=1 Tax=Nematocida minor TaxID=1912983 RepID=UPI00221FED71|nr:uncharacterized protein NEMIN01_0785 [Nematocida minor]KAI5189922.1 hypothetical protein NEMIN01_0785 [Nematocida minor]
MKSILDFYGRVASDEHPVVAYTFFVSAILLFIYTSVFLTYTYLFRELDRISAKAQLPTLGCKTLLLVFALLYSPVFTVHRDIKIREAVWHNTALLSLTVFSGICILFKPKKERVCLSSTRHTIFFQSLGTLSSPLLGVYYILSSYGSTFLFTIYAFYSVIFIQKGKNNDIQVFPAEDDRQTVLKTVFDNVLVGSEERNRRPWLSILTSSLAMGNLVYYTFLEKRYPSQILCIVLFCLGASVSLKSKKHKWFKNAYTFLCTCILLKSISEKFYMLLLSTSPGMINTPAGYIMLNTLRLAFPVLVVVSTGVGMGRYKLCFSLAISITIHIFLFQKALIMLLREEVYQLVLLDRTTMYSLVFTIISTMLLFINNEIRSGLFETEVGVLLIVLFLLYIMCLLGHSTPSKFNINE